MSRTSITRPNTSIRYRDNFPSEPNVHVADSAIDMLMNHVENGEVVVPPGYLLRHGRQPRFLARQPLLGLCAAGNIIGKPLIIYWSYDAPTEALARPIDFDRPHARSGARIFRPRRAGSGPSA